MTLAVHGVQGAGGAGARVKQLIDRPMEEGGWRCQECGEEIPVECTFGAYHGNTFEVTGYRCGCGHRWLNPEKRLVGKEPWNPARFLFSGRTNPFYGGYVK